MNNILKVSVKDIPEVVETMEKASKEIERLQENNQSMQEEMARTWEKNTQLQNIIKEAKEYIETHQCCDGKINIMTKTEFEELLEILDKGDENNEI